MKNKLYIFPVILFILGLLSCNSWLDVTPDDEITEKDLFSTGDGFRNALNGVYKTLASEAIYGKQMSWGVEDAMGQYYDQEVAPHLNDIASATAFDVKNNVVKPFSEEFWSICYNAVGNCNNIIQTIEGAPVDMFKCES